MIRGRFVIKSLDDVITGIARFDNKIEEFVAAGGPRPDDAEMKSDLNAILPTNLSPLLMFKQTDATMSYEAFKAFVENQTSHLLMNQGRLQAINGLDEREPRCVPVPDEYNDDDADYDAMMTALQDGNSNADDIIAAVNT